MKRAIAFSSFLLFIVGLFVLPRPMLAMTSRTVTGTLTAISSTTPPAQLTVRAHDTDYLINVASKTILLTRSSGPIFLDQLQIGDRLTITYYPSPATLLKHLPITATHIRNLSLQRNGGTVQGTISAIDCSAATFTLTTQRPVVRTVHLSEKTIITRGGHTIACADLQLNERALVIGTWRPASGWIEASRVIVRTTTVTGKILSITLTDDGLPAEITILRNEPRTANGTQENVVWTIHVTEKTLFLGTSSHVLKITDFRVGDHIRAVGSLIAKHYLNAYLLSKTQ
jgi:hypothetical protein